ncbi:NAD(P)-binding protein [Cadophora sp. DSE1049]|nr:NAD(P)-binding protein [Cadophora sp. DSE1049]
MAGVVDPDMYTTPFQLTKTMHREPYDEILPTKPANSQKGKIIIITGAYGGIGSATALVWAQAGASVVLTGRSPDKLAEAEQKTKKVAADSNPSATILSIPVDITMEAEVQNLYTKIQEVFGRPADILINNAGPTGPIGPSAHVPWDGFAEVVNTHFLGAALMAKHFISSQPTPADPVGTIIYISSIIAGQITPNFAAYAISKLAGQRFTEYLDAEYPRLRAFTLSPGIAETGMTNEFFRPFAKDDVRLVGMMALFLVNERADFLRGGFVSVNWDVREMEKNREEIVEKRLLKLGRIPAQLGGVGFNDRDREF